MGTRKKSTEDKIREQEQKYRVVTAALLADVSSGWSGEVSINPTNTGCSVDVRYSLFKDGTRRHAYAIEVKERERPVVDGKRLFNNVPLKCRKYELMFDEFENMKAKKKDLLYLVYLDDGNAYVFNVSDSGKTVQYQTVNVTEKYTEYDDDSQVGKIPCYLLPLRDAVKIIPSEKYMKMYGGMDN